MLLCLFCIKPSKWCLCHWLQSDLLATNLSWRPLPGAPLHTWINFKSTMYKQSYAQKRVDVITYPFPNFKVSPLKFGNRFHPTHYDGCNYWPTLQFMLKYVNKRDPYEDSTINMSKEWIPLHLIRHAIFVWTYWQMSSINNWLHTGYHYVTILYQHLTR